MLKFLIEGAKQAAGPLTMDDDTLGALLTTAMTTGMPDEVVANAAKIPSLKDSDRPEKVAASEWKKLKPFLDKVIRRRTGNRPWDGKSDLLEIGSRAFHESYPGDWVSYDPAARKLEVRGYQFRAPGEWFADLYAWSWYFEKSPPASIGTNLAKYMWPSRR